PKFESPLPAPLLSTCLRPSPRCPRWENSLLVLDSTAIRNTPSRIPELGMRLVYLRRLRGATLELVDLPPMRESDRLARDAIADLCRRARIPAEDFGL